MRRALILLVVLLTVAGAATIASAGSAARPALRLMGTSPVTFRGSGFQAHEHVSVVVIAGRRALGRALAGAQGTFLVRVVGVDVNACAGFSAVATGDRGSRATFKRAPGQCPLP